MIRVMLREIHEIELSSVCNLACRYCPHPKLEREKAHMKIDTFIKSLEHVEYFMKKGTQSELSLTGIGEAVLHPMFMEMATAARHVIKDQHLVISTNGVNMTPELAKFLASIKALVYVSTHRPEKAGLAYQMLKAAGCVSDTNTQFVGSAMDWAGQTPNWYVSAERVDCGYLARAWGVIRQCGSINACCMDAHNKHPIGHVDDAVGSLASNVIPLCAACHLEPPPFLKG
jgi:hypothetical protein